MPGPPDPRERLRGQVALVVAQLCFGLFPFLGKTAFEDFEPFAVAGWRMLFGGASLMGLAIAVHGRRAWVGWRELPRLAAMSALGVVLNQILFLNGLARSTSTNAGLVMCLIPVFTFVLATAIRQEKLTPLRAAGVMLSFSGGLSWWLGERPELVDRYAFGNLLMALNALSFSGYLVVSKPITARHPPLVVVGWVYGLSLFAVPFVAARADLVPVAASGAGWTSLVAVLLLPTFLGYLLNLYALRRLPASTTAAFIYIQPLVAATMGWWLLGERMTPALGGAALLIFVGIWLVAHRRRDARRDARTEEDLARPEEGR